MRRSILINTTALLCLIAAPFASAQRTAGESIDDTTLAVTVKAALVDSDDVRTDIVAAANTVSGVSKVHDRIALKR